MDQLPRYVALKSIYNKKYLRYREGDDDDQRGEGSLQFSGDKPNSRHTKFEVVPDKSGTMVHLKCCYNGKYWTRRSSDDWLIDGSARRRQEDPTKWSCTLFKVEVAVKDEESTALVVRFVHVQLNHYACVFRSGRSEGLEDGCLYAASEVANQDLSDACAVLDWDDSLSSTNTTVPKAPNLKKPNKLPRFVAMKSAYNHKYLRYINNDEDGEQNRLLKFSADKATNPFARFEVEEAKSGGGLVHLKCWHNGKYLARQSRDGWWIHGSAGRAVENRSNWNCTLFEPIFYENDDNNDKSMRVRFRHVQLGQYACLFNTITNNGSTSTQQFQDCLYAGWRDPSVELHDVVTIVDLDISTARQSIRCSDTQPRSRRVDFKGGKVITPLEDPEESSEDDVDDPEDVKEIGNQSAGEYDVNEEDPRRLRSRTAQLNGIKRSQPNKPKKVNKFFDEFSVPKPKEESIQKEFTIVSSANEYWGAIFALSYFLPKVIPEVYSKVALLKGDGFSEGSIRQITFSRGTPWQISGEQIVYVDHATKTITWSVVDGGIKDYYDVFKVTVTVTPKLRSMEHGCIVKWSCEAMGSNTGGLDIKSMKRFFKSTFDILDTYLLRNALRETR